jgi:hypothetical protein
VDPHTKPTIHSGSLPTTIQPASANRINASQSAPLKRSVQGWLSVDGSVMGFSGSMQAAAAQVVAQVVAQR